MKERNSKVIIIHLISIDLRKSTYLNSYSTSFSHYRRRKISTLNQFSCWAMNLSSLVHEGRHHQQFSQYNTPAVMASTLVSNPYTAQPMVHNASYAYVNAPQPPPSPPVDETSKCSLPSISSLLGLADGSSPTEQIQQQSSPQQGQLS